MVGVAGRQLGILPGESTSFSQLALRRGDAKARVGRPALELRCDNAKLDTVAPSAMRRRGAAWFWVKGRLRCSYDMGRSSSPIKIVVNFL